MASELASALIAQGDLRSQGFRYVKRAGAFLWVHPLDVRFNDVDCTDMGDDDFEAVVRGGVNHG